MIHLLNFETGRYFRKYINRILLTLTEWRGFTYCRISFLGVYFNRKAVPYD